MSRKSQILHNGISLPAEWPPRYNESETRQPMPVPYLTNIPDPIPINTGRQLFVDNFLIEKCDLKPVYHQPVYHPNNPILQADKEWEYGTNGASYAAPFSDGIWFDECDQKFKMWYLAGGKKFENANANFCTCYAESADGIAWEKIPRDVYPGTNIIDTTSRDAATVWIDKFEVDAQERYKLFLVERHKSSTRMVLKYSYDGIHWSDRIVESKEILDRSSVFYNPFTKKWIVSLRYFSGNLPRSRAYLEDDNIESAIKNAQRFLYTSGNSNPVFWFLPDDKEPRSPNFPNIEPGIYNFDCIAYESIILGLYTVWQGPENDVCQKLKIQKRNEVLVGYSRDGFHFSRPSHKPFMGVNQTPGAWNWGNVQSINGTPLIVGDSLYFYCSGRRMNSIMWDGFMSTGLAILRRDGFVSLRSESNPGRVTTRNLIFNGEYLFVNASIQGIMKVEVLDENENTIYGFSEHDCVPIKGDSTKHNIRWNSSSTLATLNGRRIKLRFLIIDGDLYSFWISKWTTGESGGYTAGGGPGMHASGMDMPTKGKLNSVANR